VACHPVGDHVVVLDNQDSRHGPYDRPGAGTAPVSEW
jgi:hypothetical protein